MKRTKQGVITPAHIKKNRWDIVKELGKSRKRGVVLDVFELEGSYALENASDLYASVLLGERLIVCESSTVPNKDMLAVQTESGKTVGFIPSGLALLPRLMLNKGCKINCYVEYKDFTNELLTICVSMYTKKY